MSNHKSFNFQNGVVLSFSSIYIASLTKRPFDLCVRVRRLRRRNARNGTLDSLDIAPISKREGSVEEIDEINVAHTISFHTDFCQPHVPFTGTIHPAPGQERQCHERQENNSQVVYLLNNIIQPIHSL